MDIDKEVLKGHIDVLLLSLLKTRDLYGYEISKLVRVKSNQLFELKEGTMYLSLKRLEKSKYIESYWGKENGPGGRRKYYRLTDNGINHYEKKKHEWELVKMIMDTFLGEGDHFD